MPTPDPRCPHPPASLDVTVLPPVEPGSILVLRGPTARDFGPEGFAAVIQHYTVLGLVPPMVIAVEDDEQIAVLDPQVMAAHGWVKIIDGDPHEDRQLAPLPPGLQQHRCPS